MAIFRVEKTRDYTVMSNHHLKNRALSLKAKGLLSVILSLPEDWDYTLKGLSIINLEGVDAIREAVRELENEGYIIRTRLRNEQGQLKGTEYVIHELPQPVPDAPVLENPTQAKPMQETPTQDEPALEGPMQENPTQLNTNRSTNQSEKMKKPKTYSANPYPSIPYPSSTQGRVEELRDTIRQNISYDCIATAANRERLDEIVSLMVETLCSDKEYITISGEDFPAELVRERLMQINSLHIEYIFHCLDKNTSYIRNIKRYMLSTLFNAPATISTYYDALVRHDRARL